MNINLLPYLVTSEQEAEETFEGVKEIIVENNLQHLWASFNKSMDIIYERKLKYKDPRFKYRQLSLNELGFLNLFFLAEAFKIEPEMIKVIDEVRLIDLFIETLDNQLDKIDKVEVPIRLQKIIVTLKYITISDKLPISYDETKIALIESKEIFYQLKNAYFFLDKHLTEEKIPLYVIPYQRIICRRLDETITLEEFIEILHIIYLDL